MFINNNRHKKSGIPCISRKICSSPKLLVLLNLTLRRQTYSNTPLGLLCIWKPGLSHKPGALYRSVYGVRRLRLAGLDSCIHYGDSRISLLCLMLNKELWVSEVYSPTHAGGEVHREWTGITKVSFISYSQITQDDIRAFCTLVVN